MNFSIRQQANRHRGPRPRPTLYRLLLLAALAVTASCGGEGATPPGPPPPPPPPPPVAPVQVGTIPNQTVETGQSVTLDVASYFRDPDGGALTYTAATSAAGVVSVSLSGSTLTMVGVADGTATVTVTARDPGGLTAVQSFGVVVETPNRAPEAVGAIPNQAVATGRTATLAVSSYFRDPDGDALTYTVASSAPTVISVAISGSTLTLVGVADGTATVTVTARDPDGLTAAQSFGVTVETPNRAPEPVGTIPNQTVNAGSTVTLDVSGYFRDPDGDALVYTARSVLTGIASVSVSGSSVTVRGVAVGSSTVTVTARDPGGLTAAQSFGVTVATANRAPEAVGTIPNQTVATGGTATVGVASYFRDPDGDALTYTASSSASAVVSVSVSGSTLRLAGVSAGTATVTVTARDPSGLTALQSFQVAVQTANRAPEAVGTIPNQTVTPGGTVTLAVSGYFRDPDGDALTYAAATSNALATASVSGSRVTVTGVAVGSATVTVTARDPSGLTAVQSFRATITASNRAPEAVGSIPGQNVSVGGTATVGVSSYFRDPDGDALTYTASSSSSSVASVSVSGNSVTISGAAAGTATVTVTARDPAGLTATQRFGVTVQGGGGGTGFRDDFNSSASLSDWDVRNADAVVTNGILRLTRTSSSSVGVAEHRLQTPLTDWTIRARVGDSDGQNELVGVWWRTGIAEYPSVGLTLGTQSNFNYAVWIFVAAERRWNTFRDLRGQSSAVRTGPSEFTSAAVGFEDGTLVVSAGDTELINLSLPVTNPFRQAFANVQSILLVNEDSPGTTASFDWVEVTGDEGGGGGGGAPDLVVSLSPSNVTVAPSGTFSYDVTVRNQGDGSSAATQGRVLISENSTITTNDREIGQYDVRSLGPSTEASGTRRLTVGSSPGTIYLGHCIDAVSGESDTGNNCSSAVTVTIESGGGDACTVGQVLTAGESCTFSGGRFEVRDLAGNSLGCVVTSSGSICRTGSVDVGGFRARQSGNRWEILALPSGDAGDGTNLTVRSAIDLAEMSKVKNTGASLISGTLEIRRKR